MSRLPVVSRELIDAATGNNDISTIRGIHRLAEENPQLLMLGLHMPLCPPLVAMAIAYELLHRQEEVDYLEGEK